MSKKLNDPYLFKKKVINGIPVYFNKLETSPCIHLEIGFKVGSLTDPVGKEGLAHFLEHMVLSGSPMYPTQKDVWMFRKKYTLDSLNAYTRYWNTGYTAKCLPKHYEKMVEGLFDFVLNPLIGHDETMREQKIIIQEAWDRLRNQKYVNYIKKWLATTKPNIDAGRMLYAIGWPETIPNISRDDLRKWYEEHYHTGNSFILLAGPIEDQHIKLLKKFLGKMPAGKQSNEAKKAQKIGPPLKSRGEFNSEDIGMKQDHATLTIYKISPRIVKNEQMLIIAENFLDAVFFEILRQEMGLCYHVDVNCYLEMNYIENEISLNMHRDRIGEAEDRVFKLLEEIKKGKYKEKFEEEKQLSIDNLKARERNSDFIMNVASVKLNKFEKISLLSETIKMHEAVTYKETVKYITDTFKKESVYIERILP